MGRIINTGDLVSHGNTEGRRVLLDIMDAGLSAADPYQNARALVRMEGSRLIFDGRDFEPAGDPQSGPAVYDLKKIGRVFVFGIGKGIQRITKALEDVLGDYLTGGHVVVKRGDEIIMERLGVTPAGHPVPDEACVEGCEKIVSIIESARLTENDLVITAVGNGVSSLCTLPYPEIPLRDVTETTRLMQIEYGIHTIELNEIRTCIDRLKGGRISRMIHPAKMVHLIGISPANPAARKDPLLSDYDNLVQNNHWLHTISVNSTAEKALGVIRRWDQKKKMPASVVRFLENFRPEYAPVGWREYAAFDRRLFGLMPESRSALRQGMRRAEQLGYTPHYLGRIVTEAAPAGRMMAQMALASEKGLSPLKPPAALFTDGELLVTCGDHPGIGGRNQEYCLAGAADLGGSRRVVMAGCDTDGTDGPGGEFHPDATAEGITVLAGGIVDGFTSDECKAQGVDSHAALAGHAVSEALWQVKSGIAATHNISVYDYRCTLIMDHDGK